MKQFALNSKIYLPNRVAIFIPAGCTQDLVKNDTRLATAGAARCSGAELITTEVWLVVTRLPQVYLSTPGINTQAVPSATQIIHA